MTTHDRAHALAETMLAVLRGSAKIKTVDLQCESVDHVELLDDNDDLARLRIKS
ncbi:MAG: hypothetical protein O7D91_13550 [Planctomycetota bacterium]|nr:hypothetical protein [Planctomycetota bacterium]